jgi:hypothetical protein
LLAASLILTASSGRAGIIGPVTTSTPILSTPTDWLGDLTFPQFNPSNGTLDSVTLVLSGSYATTLTVQNLASASSSGTAQTELQMAVQDAGNKLNVPELQLVSPGYTYTLSPSGSITSGLLTTSGIDNETYTSSALLAEFTGTGTIALPASTMTFTILTNRGGNTYTSQVTDAALTGTVTYNFAPIAVPEPPAFALLGVGVAALLGFARRGAARRQLIVPRLAPAKE